MKVKEFDYTYSNKGEEKWIDLDTRVQHVVDFRNEYNSWGRERGTEALRTESTKLHKSLVLS